MLPRPSMHTSPQVSCKLSENLQIFARPAGGFMVFSAVSGTVFDALVLTVKMLLARHFE